jgi:hypothetical protein
VLRHEQESIVEASSAAAHQALQALLVERRLLLARERRPLRDALGAARDAASAAMGIDAAMHAAAAGLRVGRGDRETFEWFHEEGITPADFTVDGELEEALEVVVHGTDATLADHLSRLEVLIQASSRARAARAHVENADAWAAEAWAAEAAAYVEARAATEAYFAPVAPPAVASPAAASPAVASPPVASPAARGDGNPRPRKKLKRKPSHSYRGSCRKCKKITCRYAAATENLSALAAAAVAVAHEV